MQTALENRIVLEDWKNAARTVGNLSELHMITGDLTQALTYARQSIDLADRCGEIEVQLADCLDRWERWNREIETGTSGDPA